jgi:hypothetical protein
LLDEIYIYLLFILLGIVINSHAQKFKKYLFKSGVIEYKMEGNAKGTQIVYWENYGYREASIHGLKVMGIGSCQVILFWKQMEQGVYFLRLYDKNGKVFSRKVIKQ